MLAISSSLGSRACASGENRSPWGELVAEQTTYKIIKNTGEDWIPMLSKSHASTQFTDVKTSHWSYHIT